jgi:hypothetical protein
MNWGGPGNAELDVLLRMVHLIHIQYSQPFQKSSDRGYRADVT